MGSTRIFNILTVIFVALSLCICLVSVLWISEAVSVPSAIAPQTPVPIPTRARLGPPLQPPPDANVPEAPPDQGGDASGVDSAEDSTP